ncbi:MAG: ATP-binding protein [Arachnia sp.]
MGQSLQARLASLTGLSVALATLFVGGTAYLATRVSLLDQIDADLLAAARAAATLISADLDNLGGVTGEGLQTSQQLLSLVSADGTVRVPPGQEITVAPEAAEIAIARVQSGYSTRTAVGSDGLTYRVVSVAMTAADGHYAVQFSRPATVLDSALRALTIVVILTGIVGVLITTVTSLVAAQGALAPVRRLSRAVSSVTRTDELNPIRIYGRDDLGQLTQSFNAMLRSLQSSRERQRQLIADAGHELRTPLTSMRTNIELLVADDKTGMLPEGARSEILDDVSAQLGEFSALVGDLVALTRDDHLHKEPELVDLEEVTQAALERAMRRGPGIAFDAQLDNSTVMGDPQTLERAITNLLDNAVKFSPPDGTVHVRLEAGALTVIDSGPGIAEEDLPHIFDRFFRSDRARNTPGTGLGLSIVAHTVDAHSGTIRASNQPGAGAKFVMRIPLADGPTPDDS